MKRQLDAELVRTAKSRAEVRAKELREHPHSKKVAAKGREILQEYQREHGIQKRAQG